MSTDFKRYFKLKSFEPGELSSCYLAVLKSVNMSAKSAEIHGSFTPSGELSEYRKLDLKQLGSICELGDNPRYLSLGLNEGYSGGNNLYLSVYRGFLEVKLSVFEAEFIPKIVSVVESTLKLEKADPPSSNSCSNEEVLQRLDLLENIANAKSEILSCFLSYRFSNNSKPLALELTRFLELLDIKVISGAGYEPRKVEEKVISRLNQPIDFLVYLITEEGESMWTRDELMVALSKGYALVLIVESGFKIEKGLLGNWEYIEFEKGHIADTFISILEAIRYIRGEKISEAK